MNEKRQLTRVSFMAKTQVGSLKHAVVEGETVNISLNGMLVKPFDCTDFRPGDAVRASISDCAASIDIDCIVIRKEKNALALQYKAIDYDALMLLKKVIGDQQYGEKKIEDEFMRFITGDSIQNGENT